jgi:hypothetical protein
MRMGQIGEHRLDKEQSSLKGFFLLRKNGDHLRRDLRRRYEWPT